MKNFFGGQDEGKGQIAQQEKAEDDNENVLDAPGRNEPSFVHTLI